MQNKKALDLIQVFKTWIRSGKGRPKGRTSLSDDCGYGKASRLLPVCTEFLLKSVGDCAPKAVKAEVLLADSDSDDPKDEDDDPNEDGDDPNVNLESDIDDPKGGRWRERERSSARICSSPESEAITLRLMLYPNKLPFPPRTYTI